MLKKQLFNKYRLLCCFVDDTLGIVTDIFSLLTCYISIFMIEREGVSPFSKLQAVCILEPQKRQGFKFFQCILKVKPYIRNYQGKELKKLRENQEQAAHKKKTFKKTKIS